MFRPDLIQRGSFKNIEESAIVGLDSLIDYDYMGSSEFEWGTLPTSLKRMVQSWGEYEWFKTDIKDADEQDLYVLCRKRQHEEVLQAIHILATEPDTIRTKESVGLKNYLDCRSDYALRITFWWDVTSNDPYRDKGIVGNDWMVCFGGDIRRLVIAINKICEKHGNNCRVPVLNWPAIPPIIEKVKPELWVEDHNGMVEVIYGTLPPALATPYADRKKIKFNKRRIMAVAEGDNNQIRLTMKAGSLNTSAPLSLGPDRIKTITIKPSSARALFLNLVKEWPEINKRRKTHG